MITCQECIESLKPDDPRVKGGRYHQSSCDCYCDKPTYYRELEISKPPQEIETTVRHVSVYDFASKRQVAKIYQLENEIIGWRQKHAEMMLAYDKAFPKKPESKYE